MDAAPPVLFWKPDEEPYGAFSNWYPAPFTVADEEYTCAEQFMMAEKARMFGDNATLAKILRTRSPKMMKRYGREVANFNEDLWRRWRVRIVRNALHAKFAQNPELAALLRGTGDRRIAEASPYDAIWGIKLRASSPRAQDPRAWRGRNLLGELLEETRDWLDARRSGGKRGEESQ